MIMKSTVWLGVLLLIFLTGCAGNDAWHGPREEIAGAGGSTISSVSAKRPGPEVAAEPAGEITLPESVAYALMNNPSLKGFSWDLRAAQARRLQAGLMPNPELGVGMEEFGGRGGRTGFDSSETTLELGQLIETAGKRSKRMRLADIEQELVRVDYESARLDVMNQVTQAFIDLLAAQERLALAKELAGLSEEDRNAVGERVKAGKDSPIDEIEAKVELSKSRLELERAGMELERARTVLATTWGGGAATFDRASGQFFEIRPVPSWAGDPGRLISESPDMARWAVEKERLLAALKLEKAGAVSDIGIGGGVRYFEETKDAAFLLGVSIPLPLFDRNQGGIREATYRLARAEDDRRAIEMKLRAGLSEAVYRLSNAFAEATALRTEVVPGALMAYEAASGGYAEGKFDYLHVLDSQRTLFEARRRYVESLAAYHKALADLERLVGGRIDGEESVRAEQLKGNL